MFGVRFSCCCCCCCFEKHPNVNQKWYFFCTVIFFFYMNNPTLNSSRHHQSHHRNLMFLQGKIIIQKIKERNHHIRLKKSPSTSFSGISTPIESMIARLSSIISISTFFCLFVCYCQESIQFQISNLVLA